MMEFPHINIPFALPFGALPLPKQAEARLADPTLADDCLSGEPSLSEILDDPIVRILMAYDRVDPDALEELLVERFC
ncbi:hypothetical protein [Jiella sp. M17.18]|uniref:hypothetical protein n=1 Tax=Jiella sp. M17.18 TaxID=3234247 RepID=UPI0034DECD2B